MNEKKLSLKAERKKEMRKKKKNLKSVFSICDK